jgi:hypothetical protein
MLVKVSWGVCSVAVGGKEPSGGNNLNKFRMNQTLGLSSNKVIWKMKDTS